MWLLLNPLESDFCLSVQALGHDIMRLYRKLRDLFRYRLHHPRASGYANCISEHTIQLSQLPEAMEFQVYQVRSIEDTTRTTEGVKSG